MVNILKEVHSDIGSSHCDDGDLTPWAKQGVLLINTVLTVEDSSANSHIRKKVGRSLQIISSNIFHSIMKISFLFYGELLLLKKQK